MSTGTLYAAEIHLRDGTIVPVSRWKVAEHQGGGWRGFIIIDPAPASILPALRTFETAVVYGLVPGTHMTLGMWVIAGTSTDDRTAIPVRAWPSTITDVETATLNDGTEDTVLVVRFTDTLTDLAGTRIWGAFQDCSPAKMLGGALSLAAGGSGNPTLTPTLGNRPTLVISQALRDDLQEIPYAIANGARLGAWLQSVFGRLGVRIETLGYPGGYIAVTLRDHPPRGTPLPMNGDGGPASAMNAVLADIRVNPKVLSRSVVLDNPTTGSSRRFGDASAVENLLYAAELGVDEAAVRAGFTEDRSNLHLVRMNLRTEQPGLLPGRVVEFPNTFRGAASAWQVESVSHAMDGAAYGNNAWIAKAGIAWRPPAPKDEGPVTVSAVVDDGESAYGEAVLRDRLGRIPLTLAFLPTLPEGSGDTPIVDEDAEAPVPVRIMLPVVQPMAGGIHGFVPGHRQGDFCRVAIQNPMFAEVVGFSYGDARRVGEEVSDVSMGVIIRHNNEKKWSGFLFRPKEAVQEEEKELDALPASRIGSYEAANAPEATQAGTLDLSDDELDDGTDTGSDDPPDAGNDDQPDAGPQ